MFRVKIMCKSDIYFDKKSNNYTKGPNADIRVTSKHGYTIIKFVDVSCRIILLDSTHQIKLILY